MKTTSTQTLDNIYSAKSTLQHFQGEQVPPLPVPEEAHELL